MRCYRVYICHNRDCKALGAGNVWQTLQHEVTRRGLNDVVELIVAGCQGRCEWGPNVTIHPGAVKYCRVDAQAARQIVACHLEGDAPVGEYVFDRYV